MAAVPVMELPAIIRALRLGSAADSRNAIRALIDLVAAKLRLADSDAALRHARRLWAEHAEHDAVEEEEALDAELAKEQRRERLQAACARITPLLLVQLTMGAAKTLYIRPEVARGLMLRVLPLAAGRVSVAEWSAALHETSRLDVVTRRSGQMQRLLLELLAVSAPALFAEGADAAAREAWLSTCVVALTHEVDSPSYRRRHGTQSCPEALSKMSFAKSPTVRRLLAVWSAVPEAAAYAKEQLALAAAGKLLLSPVGVAALATALTAGKHVAGLPLAVLKDALPKEGTVAALASPPFAGAKLPSAFPALRAAVAPVPSGTALPVDAEGKKVCELVVQRLSKAGVTLAAVVDACAAVHGAVAAADVSAFFADAARLKALLDPVVQQPKVFTAAAAPTIGAAYAAMMPPADDALVAKVVSTAASMLGTRCGSGGERAALLSIVAAFLANAPGALPAPAAFTPLLKSVIASPAPEVFAAAWSVVRLLPLAHQQAAEAMMKPVFKNAAADIVQRRVVLTAVHPELAAATQLTTPLLQGCHDTVLFRPDAALAFRVHGAVAAAKLEGKVAETCAVAFDGVSLASFESPLELRCACDAAAVLAADHKVFGGVTALMTHPSGLVRLAAGAAFAKALTGTAAALAAWKVIATDVFAVASRKAPAALSRRSAEAIVAGLAPLVADASCIDAPQTVAEALLCFASDPAVGSDATHFRPTTAMDGLYRAPGVGRRTARTACVRFFKSEAAERLVVENAAAAMAHLVAAMGTTPSVAAAASRAVPLLLAVVPASMHADLLAPVMAAVEESRAYFEALSPMDVAIADGSYAATSAFEAVELKARGLRKEYGPRPPKGVSVEDFEDTKRKDAVALKAGTAKLREEMQKRAAVLGDQPALKVAPFTAIRTLGTVPDACSADAAAAALPPLLEILQSAELPAVLRQHATDAAVSVVAATPLAPVAAPFVYLSGRLPPLELYTALDVTQANALAARLRLSGVSMLPAPLVPVLLPLLKGMFKPVQSKLQVSPQALHQTLGIFANNCGNPAMHGKRAALEFLLFVLDHFHAVYKMTSNAIASVLAHAAVADVPAVLDTLAAGTDLARESVAAAFVKFQHFDNHRQALLLAAALLHDSRNNVTNAATKMLAGAEFAFVAGDWYDLVSLLGRYADSPAAVEKISRGVLDFLKEHSDTQDAAVDRVIEIGGTAAVRTVHVIIPVLTPATTEKALLWLTDLTENEATTEAVSEVVLACGRELLTKCDAATLKAASAKLQPRLRATPTAKGPHRERFSAIATSWLTVMATRSDDMAYLESVIDNVTAVLGTSQTPMVHYISGECVADIVRHKLMRKNAKVAEFATHCLKQTLNSTSYIKKKAHASGLAGVVTGTGVLSLRRHGIMTAVVDSAKEKQTQRSGSMVLLETLADALGCTFEPYLLATTQIMLDSVAEKDPKIAECADDAAKAMMRNLTDVGLRQLVPQLVEGLESEQNKKKASALGLIGYVAFCSPKQLAAALPSVVPHICDCLFDVNGGVANAAFNALKRVAGVVANYQIQEHVDVLLDAMRRPADDTEAALDALLHTRFNTAVDPASLALVVPVLQRGLGERDSAVRGKAAQIIASLTSLVQDPSSLMPYAKEMVARLETTVQDPQAPVRSASARAMAVLCGSLSTTLVDSTLEWARNILRRPNTSVAEKGGAGETIMEMCASVGERCLFGITADLEDGAHDEDANVRHSYMHVFVYAPITLPPAMFMAFLPTVFPWVLHGLADKTEKVRTVALQAGTNILTHYGSRNLDLVLEPLLQGVCSEVSSKRQSSLLLASKLLVHMVQQVRKKFQLEEPKSGEDNDGEDEEEEAVAKEVFMESARDVEKRGVSVIGHLEEQLGTDNFVRMMAAIHVCRHEDNAAVRSEVTMAWQVCVASIRTVLHKIFPGIVELVVKFASSDSFECVDLATKSIGYTCQRIHEMIDNFVVALSKQYEVDTRRHKMGALIAMAETIPHSEAQRITRLGPQIVACVLPALQAEDETIRTCAGTVFERVSKLVGPKWVDTMVEQQLGKSIVGVVELVRVRPKASLGFIFKKWASRLEEQDRWVPDDLRLLYQLLLLDEHQEAMMVHSRDIMLILLAAAHQHDDPELDEAAEEAAREFAAICLEEYLPTLVDLFVIGMRAPATRVGTLNVAGRFGVGLDSEAVVALESIFRVVIQGMGDAAEAVRKAAADAFMALTASFETKLDTEHDATALKRAAGRYSVGFLDTVQSSLMATVRSTVTSDEPEFAAFTLPKLFNTVVSHYMRALDYGETSHKLIALEGIEDILAHVPKKVLDAEAVLISGRSLKLLFDRNDGKVVAGVLSLCLRFRDAVAGTPKAQIVNTAICSSLVGAAFCDSPHARIQAHRVVKTVLDAEPARLGPFLVAVTTRKSSAETTVQKAALCRYVSVLLRHAPPAQKLPPQTAIGCLTLVSEFWRTTEAPALAAAAGSAVAALCRNAAVSDSTVFEYADEALAMLGTKGPRAAGGLACATTLLTAASERIEADYARRAAEPLRALLPMCINDRTFAAWGLRCAAVVCSDPAAAQAFGKIDGVLTLLTRVEHEDLLLSAAHYSVNVLAKVFPAQAAALTKGKREESSYIDVVGAYDFDVEDDIHAPLR